ncbi:MAG TPA: hypothetical protein EYG69_02720 [Campylobacterales bacterium]|nr:hypothetical protein [Campylobacterales bacterium]
MKLVKHTVVVALAIILLAGCTGSSYAGQNTKQGAILGGIAGAVIGSATGDGSSQRMIRGALIGSAVGGSIGYAQDNP